MSHKDERLFTALAAAAERSMREFNEQALANTAWAFAMVGHEDERLFSALVAAAEWRMWEFKLQELVNMAWALTDSAACALVS